MALVLQVYAPVEDSVHHRVLYVMVCAGCPAADGEDTWRTVRAQFIDPALAAAAAAVSVAAPPLSSAKAARTTAASAAAAAATTATPSTWGLDGVDDWGDADDDAGWGAVVAPMTPAAAAATPAAAATHPSKQADTPTGPSKPPSGKDF
jgi:hypothetical protein